MLRKTLALQPPRTSAKRQVLDSVPHFTGRADGLLAAHSRLVRSFQPLLQTRSNIHLTLFLFPHHLSHSTGVMDDDGILCTGQSTRMQFELRSSLHMEAAVGHTAWVRTECSPPPPDVGVSGSLSIAVRMSAGGLSILLACIAGFYAMMAMRKKKEASISYTHPRAGFELLGSGRHDCSVNVKPLNPTEEPEEALIASNAQSSSSAERLMNILDPCWRYSSSGRDWSGWSGRNSGNRVHAQGMLAPSAPSESHVHIAHTEGCHTRLL